MPLGSRVPQGSWIVCPNEHYVAEAVKGLSFKDANWSANLSSVKQPLKNGAGERRCNQCGEMWLSQRGGNGFVNWTQTPPE